MDENWIRIAAKFLGFLGAISFGVAAKTIIDSKKQKIYKKFVLIDLITAAFVGYLILPYLSTSEVLTDWKGQILAMCGYLGTWILNVLVKFFKAKTNGIVGAAGNDKEKAL
jgi:hypothetical protein